MAEIINDQADEQDGPEAICTRFFSRCANWPKNRLGIIGLAQGLGLAARETGIAAEEIADECRRISTFCPTDADLLRVAHDLNAQRQEGARLIREEAERRGRGRPEPFDYECVDWKRVEAVRRRRDQLWDGLRIQFGVKNGKWPDWPALAAAARELGYQDYARAWGA